MPIAAVMLVKTKQKISEDELKDLRTKFVNEMNLTKEDFYYEGALIKVTDKDYEIIPAADREFLWLGVNFSRAFYSPEYKRGDIKLYIRCAEWLEKEIPDCEIYYGNDADDESIVLFNKQKRRMLSQA